jgi:ABC-type sugar transport system permease subunit
VAVGLSITKWDGFSLRPEYVGFSNYIKLFETVRFRDDLAITFFVWFAVVFLQLPFALFLAIGLSKQGPLLGFFRTVFFFPQVMSTTVVALTWRNALNPEVGFVNKALTEVGLGSLSMPWLGDERTALPWVTISLVWWMYGLFTTMYVAGLANIPSEYYEALRLESDRWYHRLWYVTLPMLRETLLITFAMATGIGFGHSIGYFNLMTMGGPAGSTELLGLYSVTTALRGRQFGYASAITTTLLCIVVAIVILPIWHTARERLEYT